jgi:hypothetical protein
MYVCSTLQTVWCLMIKLLSYYRFRHCIAEDLCRSKSCGIHLGRVCVLQKINSSTMLEEDVDIVDASDVRLLRHLGNGAFGTVREGDLHHTPVAVKILKEGEVGGALGSLALASGNSGKDLQDIRKHLIQVRCWHLGTHKAGRVRRVDVWMVCRHVDICYLALVCVRISSDWEVPHPCKFS